MLKAVLKNKPNVDVVKLHKSGGVVTRNVKVRQKSRSSAIRVSCSYQDRVSSQANFWICWYCFPYDFC